MQVLLFATQRSRKPGEFSGPATRRCWRLEVDLTPLRDFSRVCPPEPGSPGSAARSPQFAAGASHNSRVRFLAWRGLPGVQPCATYRPVAGQEVAFGAHYQHFCSERGSSRAGILKGPQSVCVESSSSHVHSDWNRSFGRRSPVRRFL